MDYNSLLIDGLLSNNDKAIEEALKNNGFISKTVANDMLPIIVKIGTVKQIKILVSFGAEIAGKEDVLRENAKFNEKMICYFKNFERLEKLKKLCA